MSVYGRKDRLGQVMFWAALLLVPMSLLSRGHERAHHFVLGFAAGLMLAGLLGLLLRRGSHG